MRSKEKIFIGVVLFYITCLFFPVITGLLHIPVWFPSIVVSVTLLAMYPKVVLRNKTFYWLMLYFLVVFLFISFGRTVKLDIGRGSSYAQLIIEYAFLLPNVIICLVLLYLNDYRIVTILGKSFVILLIFSFIVLIPQLRYVDLRAMAIKSLLDDSSTNEYIFINYTLLHVYVFLIPVFYYCCVKIDGLFKRLSIVLLLMLIYIVFRSNITTCLIIGIVTLSLSVVISSRNKAKTTIYFLLFFSVVMVLYKSGAFVSLLNAVRPLFEGTAVELKIDDALDLLSTGQTSGSIEARENLHQISRDGFYSNIILGSGRAGGHSSILDRLATMGLVGFIPYFMIYYTIVSQFVKRLDRFSKRYYYLDVFSVVVILYTKGIFGQEGNLVFMVLVPVLLLLPEHIKTKAALSS